MVAMCHVLCAMELVLVLALVRVHCHVHGARSQKRVWNKLYRWVCISTVHFTRDGDFKMLRAMIMIRDQKRMHMGCLRLCSCSWHWHSRHLVLVCIHVSVFVHLLLLAYLLPVQGRGKTAEEELGV